METTDRVWLFMLDHQQEHGKPPTMQEIATAMPTLNYRSSARYVLQQLAEEGRVIEAGEPGTACRHRAVPQEGADIISSSPVFVIPVPE